jgi:hypothetical protein
LRVSEKDLEEKIILLDDFLGSVGIMLEFIEAQPNLISQIQPQGQLVQHSYLGIDDNNNNNYILMFDAEFIHVVHNSKNFYTKHMRYFQLVPNDKGIYEYKISSIHLNSIEIKKSSKPNLVNFIFKFGDTMVNNY